MTLRHRRLQLTTSTSEGKASHIVLVANDFLTVYEYLGDHARVSEPMLAFVGEYHFYDQLHGVVVARRADAKKDRSFSHFPGGTPSSQRQRGSHCVPLWRTRSLLVCYKDAKFAVVEFDESAQAYCLPEYP